jgi:hypothetical protein
MNDFGKVLFSGSRFIFWSLAPFLILFAIVMPFSVNGWTATKIILVGVSDIAALLLVLGLWNPNRFRWALRCVAAIVFGVCLTAIIEEIFLSGKRFTIGAIISGDAQLGALKGFIFLGASCLIYTLLGRFSSVREKLKVAFFRKRASRKIARF